MNTCPPLRYWIAAVLVGAVMGNVYRLDAGPDELTAAESTAADLADAQTLANASANEAAHRQACTAAKGEDAIFFTTAKGLHVCRPAPRSTT